LQYSTRPFVAGDKVQLLSMYGGVVAEGTVSAVDPLRTVLVDEYGALVYVNNSSILSALIVKNLTFVRQEAPRPSTS
jgi:hypothetical protein